MQWGIQVIVLRAKVTLDFTWLYRGSSSLEAVRPQVARRQWRFVSADDKRSGACAKKLVAPPDRSDVRPFRGGSSIH